MANKVPHLTLTSIFHYCTSMLQFKQAHARLVVTGQTHPSSAFRPIFSFSALHPFGDIDYALVLLFHTQTPIVALFPFNTLIRGFARRGRLDSLLNSVVVYNHIPAVGLVPNNFTFTFLFQCCSSALDLHLGRQLHCTVVKKPVQTDVYVRNSIIQFYSVCVELDDATRVFDEHSVVDVVSWNSLLGGYVRHGKILEALELFDRMTERSEVSWNLILMGLVRHCHLSEASRLFSEMPIRSLTSWVIMLSGFSQYGCPSEALALFREMQLAGPEPSTAVLVSVLSAISQLGALNCGKWIHTYIQRKHLRTDAILSAALIDMYAKCGSIELAKQVFESSHEKNVHTYTAAISGLAIGGEGEESIRLFEQMKGEGIVPDSVSYIAVLCACSHTGSVEKGFYYFNSMTHEHGIEPELDHYACMVDILGRTGLVEEAERFIASMPIEPDNAVWGALLGSCRLHMNYEMAQRVGSFLLESDQHHDGRYILLSNIYIESKKEHKGEEVRRLMRERKIKQVPGCSSIEVNGVVHQFVAGDR